MTLAVWICCNFDRREERVWRAQRLEAKIYAVATFVGGRDRIRTHYRREASGDVCCQMLKRPPIEATFTSYLSCLRLLGVLGERKPSFGHFDEKGLMFRSAGCLRQSNALSSVVA